MSQNLQLGTISLLTTDRQASAQALNKLISEHGHNIRARLGLHVQPHCAEHCTGLITLAMEATEAEIKDLFEKLNEIPEITAKYVILTKE
jgi:metal-responsive CopG/Arc/MetJ family transcriptional regulator